MSDGTSGPLSDLQAQIRAAITDALRADATSTSSYQGALTGNSYQSVRLGDEVLQGFREPERDIFRGLVLDGKSVADMGCNLGEVCRDALRHGAAEVTGFEYDPFFLQVARYVTAYNGMDRIRYVQADLSHPAAYSGTFDTIFALSVFTYVGPHLATLAGMTRELLIVETHSVRPDWQEIYLVPLRENFAHVALVGFADHRSSDRTEVRYLLLASHTDLHETLFLRARQPGARIVHALNLRRSCFPHYDQVFAALGIDRPTALADAAERVTRNLGALTPDRIILNVHQNGVIQAPLYWAALLIGWLQYKRAGQLEVDNFYYRSLLLLYERGLYDSGLRDALRTPDLGLERVGERLRALEAASADASTRGEPIVLFNPVLSSEARARDNSMLGQSTFRVEPGGRDVRPVAVDGHHRLFTSYMTGVEHCACELVWYPQLHQTDRGQEGDAELAEASWASVFPLSQDLCAPSAADRRTT